MIGRAIVDVSLFQVYGALFTTHLTMSRPATSPHPTERGGLANANIDLGCCGQSPLARLILRQCGTSMWNEDWDMLDLPKPSARRWLDGVSSLWRWDAGLGG